MNKTSVLLFCILIFFIYWTFWIPGIRAATDYHISDNETVVSSIQPFIWKETNISEGLGEYTASTLWSQPLHSLFGTLALFGMPLELRTKILGALVLITAFVSVKSLLSFTEVGAWGETVGSLFYLTNTFFVLMFDGGQLSLALAYGVLPAVVLFFLRVWKYKKFKDKIRLSFSLLVLSFLDIRLIFIATTVFFIYFLLQIVLGQSKGLIRTYLQIFILSAFILLAGHFYWLLPSILAKAPALPVGYSRSSQVDFLSFSTIGHSIFLQQPHWYKNIFGKISPLNVEFIFIPFLAFLALFLKRRDYQTLFWATIALVGIFLSKGSQEPLSNIYSWLFANIPGFSVFRDPIKFYFLTSLAYSVLIGITAGELRRLIKFSPLLIVAYLILILSPVFLGQMTGLFSIPSFENEFNQLASTIKSDPSFSRVFWIPTQSPLGYSNKTHPYLEAGRVLNHRPFAIGTKGTYERFNFLREASFMGQIFDVSGIGYISYPYPDSKNYDLSFDNVKYFYTFLNQLSNLPWLTKIPDSKIPLFKVKNHQDKFFVTPNVWWIIGSDNIYNEATKSAELKLSRNALILSEESPGLGEGVSETPGVKIVLNSKTNLDLAASFINASKIIFPAKDLNFNPDKISGWWKREAADLISWRDFLQTKYGIDNQDFDLGGGWAVGESSLKLKVKSEKLRAGQVLLARVLESTRSGQLKFLQNGELVGEVNTSREGNNVRWFEVGQLIKDGQLNIESAGDINVVNALAVLDKNEWAGLKDKARRLESRVVSFDEKNATSSGSVIVRYQQINPTKYIVNVTHLTNPAFLIFSENFDSLWKMNGQAPLPVYSLLNGFKIDRDGEYLVEFSAQKYVYIGLIISGITLAGFILLLKRK